MADIFTKPLGLDKVQYFSDMLGLQHLDVPYLRGTIDEDRIDGRSSRSNEEDELEPEPTKGKGRAEEEDKLETTDSCKGDDSYEQNQEDVKRMRRQPKTMPTVESRQIEGRRSHKGKTKADEGLGSKRAHRAGRGARDRMG